MNKKIKLIVAISIVTMLIVFALILNRINLLSNDLLIGVRTPYTTIVQNKTYDITDITTETPNTPSISAGMIPVKWNGTNCI